MNFGGDTIKPNIPTNLGSSLLKTHLDLYLSNSLLIPIGLYSLFSALIAMTYSNILLCTSTTLWIDFAFSLVSLIFFLHIASRVVFLKSGQI